MTLDDKNKLKGNSLEVPFEGTIEVDPSSIEIEDDGSMSEPSFNSEEVIDDNDFDIDNEELQPSRFAADELDNYSDEELIDDDLDEELIDDDLEDISSDEQFSDDSISDSNQEVSSGCQSP